MDKEIKSKRIGNKYVAMNYPIIKSYLDFKKVLFANLLPVLIITNTLLPILLFFKPSKTLTLSIGILNILWMVLLYDLKYWVSENWNKSLRRKLKQSEDLQTKK